MRVAGRQGSMVIALALAATGAWGQTGAGAPDAGASALVGAEPGATTATYGDWVLRCEAATAVRQRLCEVVQTILMQERQAPVAQVAFGKLDGGADLHFVAALPVNVAFPSSVRAATGDADPHPLELAWKRCLPGACFADAVAPTDVVGRWRMATAPGRLLYANAAGRDVALPLSFHGLAQALDALAKQP